MNVLEAERTLKVLQDDFNAGKIQPMEVMVEVNKVLGTVLNSLGRGHDDIDWVNAGGRW